MTAAAPRPEAAAYINRLPLPARLGTYSAHRRVYEVCPDRPLYRRMGDFAMVLSATPVAGAQSKVYTPSIRAGDWLHVVLLADVSRSAFDRGKRGKRYDPVLKARNIDSQRAYADIAEEVAQAALTRWGERHGFALQALRSADYTPLDFVRPHDKRCVRLPTIDMEGVVEVTDANAFTEVLLTGIGRGKGFGCGLLLARRTS